jgi:adenosylcobinamide hydrolase
VDGELHWRQEGGLVLPTLVVRFERLQRAVSSAPLGGGLGLARFFLNAQVPPDYTRCDPDAHLRDVAAELGLAGPCVGMLTAADVGAFRARTGEGVSVLATVGLAHPVLAAAPPPTGAVSDEPGGRTVPDGPGTRGIPEDQRDPIGAVPAAGTINLLVRLPVRLADAALVNAVATATEAKVQALLDLGLYATGTATDAVCVVCPPEGPPEPFGGPRSTWGARLARVVHAAVTGADELWTCPPGVSDPGRARSEPPARESGGEGPTG